RRESALGQHLEAAARAPATGDPERRDRLLPPFDADRAGALGANVALDEWVRISRYQDGSGLRGLLDPGRENGRAADRAVVDLKVVADLSDHDEAGVAAVPVSQLRALA